MSGTIWSKFYWSDWRSEPSIRMVSLAARGLWIELLALMAEAEPYGHLLVNGKPPTDAQIALLVGSPVKQVAALREELEAAGAYSKTEGGIIFSRRMVRDAQRSQKGREAVAKRYSDKPTGEPSRSPSRSPNSQSTEHLEGLSGNSHKPYANSQKPIASNQKEEGADAPGAPPLDLLAAAPSLPDDCEAAMARYNLTAAKHGLAEAQVLNDRRRAALKARLKEAGGLEGWDVALGKIGDSTFLRGGGASGFRADFDFLLQAKSFTKLMEGGYDDKARGVSRAPPSEPALRAADDILDRLRGTAA